MSICNTESMTNHHQDIDFSHPFAMISDTLHVWRERYRRRQELTHLTDRDLHDVGASWGDFAHEASKPFWRA